MIERENPFLIPLRPRHEVIASSPNLRQVACWECKVILEESRLSLALSLRSGFNYGEGLSWYEVKACATGSLYTTIQVLI